MKNVKDTQPEQSETYRVLKFYDYAGWDTILNQDKTKAQCEAYVNKEIAKNPNDMYMIVKVERFYVDGNDYVGEALEEKLSREDI